MAEPNEATAKSTGFPDADAKEKPKVLRLTSKAKSAAVQRVAQRGGKAIGQAAAKRKATKLPDTFSGNGKDKPIARPKGAQGGFTESGRITRLKKAEERAAKGTAKYEQFLLYRDGQTVSEYIKKGGKISWLRRDVKFGHIKVTKS